MTYEMKSAAQLVSEMRANRAKKRTVVTDENGKVDVVKTPTSLLFKSRMRGNR